MKVCKVVYMRNIFMLFDTDTSYLWPYTKKGLNYLLKLENYLFAKILKNCTKQCKMIIFDNCQKK